MKKAICILQSIVILLSLMSIFTGCEPKMNKETQQLVGAWMAKVDMAPALMEGMKEGLGENADSMLEHFTFQNYIVYDIMMLYSDGTYSRYADEDHLNALLQNIKLDVARGLRSYYAQLAKDMNVTTINTAGDAWIQYCTGKTVAELVDSICNESMQKSVLEASKESKGRYKAEDGKIYFSEDLEQEPDEKLCDVYKLEGDKLTILECHCEMDGVDKKFNDIVYPIVYTRES